MAAMGGNGGPDGNVTPPTAVVRAQVKPRDLVQRVVDRTGAKKNEVKGVVEATIAVLGDALEAGEELNLQPMGKMAVKRERTNANGKVLMVKLVRKSARPEGDDGLAQDDADV